MKSIYVIQNSINWNIWFFEFQNKSKDLRSGGGETVLEILALLCNEHRTPDGTTEGEHAWYDMRGKEIYDMIEEKRVGMS